MEAKTLNEIHKQGIDALVKVLGPIRLRYGSSRYFLVSGRQAKVLTTFSKGHQRGKRGIEGARLAPPTPPRSRQTPSRIAPAPPRHRTAPAKTSAPSSPPQRVPQTVSALY
jgi:hypothetical protein